MGQEQTTLENSYWFTQGQSNGGGEFFSPATELWSEALSGEVKNS
jgi:hypothetical protein